MTENNYKQMAKFYRALLSKRDFFEKQARVLDEIFLCHEIGRGARILDASCGTGDVLSALRREGYQQLAGSDGSATMLAQAADPGVSVYHSEWLKLGSLFESIGGFDAIFMMGNSIAHASAGDLERIVRGARDGLNDSGILVFDFRRWSETPEGLRESGRAERTWRSLGSLDLDGRTWDAGDWIDYTKEDGALRQIVRYRYVPSDGHGAEVTEELNYSPWTEEFAQAALRAGGFTDSKIKLLNYSEEPWCWPYQIAVGVK